MPGPPLAVKEIAVGFDIHVFVERRVGANPWEKVGAVFSRIADQLVVLGASCEQDIWQEVIERDIDRPWFDRDYQLFSMFGFPLRWRITAIATLRGLPRDVSAEVADELGREDYQRPAIGVS